MFAIFAHTMLLDSKQFPNKKSLVCGLQNEKQVKLPVLSDWSSPVLPYWSPPAIGNGEWGALSQLSALAVQVLYHHVFPGTSALLVLAMAPRFDRGVTVDKQKLFVFKL